MTILVEIANGFDRYLGIVLGWPGRVRMQLAASGFMALACCVGPDDPLPNRADMGLVPDKTFCEVPYLYPKNFNGYRPERRCNTATPKTGHPSRDLQRWATGRGHPAGHRMVQTVRSPAGELVLDLALAATASAILVDQAGNASVVQESSLLWITPAGEVSYLPGQSPILGAALHQSGQPCVLNQSPLKGIPTATQLHCLSVPGLDLPEETTLLAGPLYRHDVNSGFFHTDIDGGCWAMFGWNGTVVTCGTQTWSTNGDGFGPASAEGVTFADSEILPGGCAPWNTTVDPRSGTVVSTASRTQKLKSKPPEPPGRSSDFAMPFCLRGPDDTVIPVTAASRFTPGGREVVCGSTCGPPPLFSKIYTGNPGETLKYGAWWHKLADGTTMHLGALLGAFANDDLLTNIGRVDHKLGYARWTWPTSLNLDVGTLARAHVVIDSHDVLYIGLPGQIVALTRKGKIWWRSELPPGATVSGMGMASPGQLWVTLTLPGNVGRVLRFD